MARLFIVDDNQELARLIASAARARGHQVRVAFTGREALAIIAAEGFEAAVVDLLLPDLRGSEILGALREKAVPSIAISGIYKGHRFAQEATEVHGARAFFEKPFESGALLSAIEELTGPADEIARAAEEASGSVDELWEELNPVQQPEPAAPAPAPPPPGTPAALLPLQEWEQLWKQPRPAAAGGRKAAPTAAETGTLAPGSVPRLLNAYYQARHTGELRLQQGQVVKIVTFEEGRPVYAASNLAHERFARFCGRKGLLPESELAAVSALAKEQGVRTGDAMVQLDLITEAQRRALLEDQVKETLWSTFSWADGQYSFSARRAARQDLVRLSVFPGALILEGVLRTETLLSLRAKLAPSRRLVPTADPPYELHELPLSGGQALLLAHADGSKTVGDLVTLSDLSEREALGALSAFEVLGLLEERRDEKPRRRVDFGF